MCFDPLRFIQWFNDLVGQFERAASFRARRPFSFTVVTCRRVLRAQESPGTCAFVTDRIAATRSQRLGRRCPAPDRRRAFCFCQRPYCVEYTRSHPNSEVKQRKARSVLGWGTAWEVLRVLLAFCVQVLKRVLTKDPATLRQVRFLKSGPYPPRPPAHITRRGKIE